MFQILTLPTKSLREPSRELRVDEITTPEFQKYLNELIETMVASNGVGIASPQVGKNIRAIVVATAHGPECFINAEITKKSEALEEGEEGCLSVPGKYGMVMRYKKVTIRALTRHGRHVEFEVKKFPAVIFQHEIDHTDGILFIDKAKNVKTEGKFHI